MGSRTWMNCSQELVPARPTKSPTPRNWAKHESGSRNTPSATRGNRSSRSYAHNRHCHSLANSSPVQSTTSFAIPSAVTGWSRGRKRRRRLFCAARISSRSHADSRASTKGSTRSRRSRSRNASSRADFSSSVSAVPRVVVVVEDADVDVDADGDRTVPSSSSRGRATRRRARARATRGFGPRSSSDAPDARATRAPDRDDRAVDVDANVDARIRARATSPSMRDDGDDGPANDASLPLWLFKPQSARDPNRTSCAAWRR